MAPPTPPQGRSLPDAAVAFLLVAFSSLMHVAYAGMLPLTPQESYYWQYSRHPALSYFDHPPAAAWTTSPDTRHPPADSWRSVCRMSGTSDVPVASTTGIVVRLAGHG